MAIAVTIQRNGAKSMIGLVYRGVAAERLAALLAPFASETSTRFAWK
jgi:hypothetical protein